jgi:ribonuclease J
MKVYNEDDTKVFALGGLGEVGRNMYVVEYKDTILIIDSGVRFPGAVLTGVDYIVPDFTYLIVNQHKIKALIITHGHEDHIGGIPFLLLKVRIPLIITPRFSKELIDDKLKDFRIKEQQNFLEFNDKTQPLPFGEVLVDFVEMTHSTPDSFGIRIKTPNGTIFTTGDFKIDLTPTGNDINLSKLALFGSEGVTLYLADSTNAESKGVSRSESDVSQEMNNLFKKYANNRILIATFSSNVYRLQQVIHAAIKNKRKIFIYGRSMEKTIRTAREIGYIHCPESAILAKDDLYSVPANEVLIICTGSQGEPLAALSKMSNGTHDIKISDGDIVIFSSSPIPGNAQSINSVVNNLAKLGANVVTNSTISTIHASGHANQEEMKFLLKLIKPKYFMPIHGEYRMLKTHGQIAVKTKIDPNNVFICANGDAVILSKGSASFEKGFVSPPPNDIYISGSNVSGLSKDIVENRNILKEDGIVCCTIVIDSRQNLLLIPPKIFSKGFEVSPHDHEILEDAVKVVSEKIEALMLVRHGFNDLKSLIINTIEEYIEIHIKRKPSVVPVVLDHANKLF